MLLSRGLSICSKGVKIFFFSVGVLMLHAFNYGKKLSIIQKKLHREKKLCKKTDTKFIYGQVKNTCLRLPYHP